MATSHTSSISPMGQVQVILHVYGTIPLICLINISQKVDFTIKHMYTLVFLKEQTLEKLSCSISPQKDIQVYSEI